MLMFYLRFTVAPTLTNPHFEDVEGALASCWVVADNPQSAYSKAACNILQYDWVILGVVDQPTVTTLENFTGKDIGSEQFLIAQEYGIATTYIAHARDGKSCYGPLDLKRTDAINPDSYLSKIRKLKRRGRCLHFDSGVRCTKIIEAHSIQKNGVLSLIADNGKVYARSSKYGDFKRNLGKVSLSKQGINTVSTFRGFCEKHDNEVFEPIDKAPFTSTKEQVLLYAYRALCRELFVKQYSLELYEKQVHGSTGNAVFRKMFDGLQRGTKFGLKNLYNQKRFFDQSVSEQLFSEMRYVTFCTDQEPTTVFSGVLYPDFDFLGRQLQDLSDHTRVLDLLAFSFVPLEKGWGFLFAWHSQSSETCVPFMKSLAMRIYDRIDSGDLLFRFVIAACENMAVSPTWWESLPDQMRESIEATASCGTDLLKSRRSDYLAAGFENVTDWKFERVISEME